MLLSTRVKNEVLSTAFVTLCKKKNCKNNSVVLFQLIVMAAVNDEIYERFPLHWLIWNDEHVKLEEELQKIDVSALCAAAVLT